MGHSNIYLLIVGLGFISICIACKKDKQPDQGTGSALINGAYWEGKIRASERFEKFDLVLEKQKKIGGTWVDWETIGLVYFNKNLQTQKLINSDSIKTFAPWDAVDAYGSFSTAQDDGDVTCDMYGIIESDSTSNWVRIDKQKNNYSEVWGSFGMHLYRKRSCSSTIYPDTLFITNGQFHFVL